MGMRRPGLIPVGLALVATLILTLWPASPAAAELRVLRPKGAYPFFLVLREEGDEVAQAFLRTPTGTYPLREVEGLRLAAMSQAQSREDQDGKDDLLWKLTFLPASEKEQGVQIWFGHLTALPKLWVVEAPVGPTQWDTMTTTLRVPRGTAVYVSPQVPSYGKLPVYEGKSALTFVYSIRLTPQGPAFVPVREVYRQLAEHQDTLRRGEYEPLKRLAYQRQMEDYLGIAQGKTPSLDALRSFTWKKLLSVEWRP